jgi:hypothetical protein
MTAGLAVPTRLLRAASFVAAIAAAHPAPAQPFSAYVASDAPARVAHSPIQPGVVIGQRHYVPVADDRFDPVPPPPASADVLPPPHDDADEPSVTVAPETIHYDHAPIGLTDNPSGLGLVAKF